VSAHPGYETHPAAEVLPLEGEAFDALVADIRGNGLIAPNILIDGRMALDCRNRIRVCIAGGPGSKDPFVVRHSRRDAKKKEGHLVAIPQAVPEPPLRASSDSSERD
jgi:hypothetical protein